MQDQGWERGFMSAGRFLAMEWRLENRQVLNTKKKKIKYIFFSSSWACRKQDSKKSLWLASCYRRGWGNIISAFLKVFCMADYWKKAICWGILLKESQFHFYPESLPSKSVSNCHVAILASWGGRISLAGRKHICYCNLLFLKFLKLCWILAWNLTSVFIKFSIPV